jgi:hypothetical protein
MDMRYTLQSPRERPTNAYWGSVGSLRRIFTITPPSIVVVPALQEI